MDRPRPDVTARYYLIVLSLCNVDALVCTHNMRKQDSVYKNQTFFLTGSVIYGLTRVGCVQDAVHINTREDTYTAVHVITAAPTRARNASSTRGKNAGYVSLGH